MSKTYLIYDMHNLAWRAFHAFSGLSNEEGIPTGVMYNVLGTILHTQGKFGTDCCLFAFDSRKNKRKEIYKPYKAHREERTPEEMEKLWDLISQVKKLKEEVLPKIGFQNIFRQPGYEADDIVASLCKNLPNPNDRSIVVSSDSDLLQLLNSRTTVYDPKKQLLYTTKVFKKIYGIKPRHWAEVKAIAGCPSDGIKGIPGVGEKGAIQFLNGGLKPESAKFAKIVNREGLKIRKRNLELIKLPIEGTKVFKIKKDTPNNWNAIFNKYNIKTLEVPEVEYRPKPKKELT